METLDFVGRGRIRMANYIPWLSFEDSGLGGIRLPGGSKVNACRE